MSTHEVTSEISYDLMQEHLDTIITLLDAPMSIADITRRLGSEATLQRLQRHGLVHIEAGQVHAVARKYNQHRQEGMMTFLLPCAARPTSTASRTSCSPSSSASMS